MKKISKFWLIYVICVAVIMILICAVLVYLSSYLKNYEIKAQAEAAVKRAAEAQHLLEVRDEAERQSAVGIAKRKNLIAAVKVAANSASVNIAEAVSSSPERVMDAVLLSLNEHGISAVSEYVKCEVGKYEDPNAVFKYIDALPGAYSYETVSKLEYTLKKGGLDMAVSLAEGPGEKNYGVSAVSVTIPLVSHKVTAPEGARITVNGKDADEQPEYQKQSYADSIPSFFTVPQIALYEFDGFIYRPEIKAYSGGKECSAVNYENKTVFTNPPNEKYKTELFDRICELSFAYSDFVAGAFKFEEMKPFLYSGTKLYRNLSSFDNRWYYEFHHIVNEYPKITELTVISDNLVSAHIEFNQSLRSEKDKTYNDIRIKLTVYIGCDRVPKGDDKSAWLLVHVE